MPNWSDYYSSRNAEGYHDPTASGAFDRMDKEQAEDDKVHKLISTPKNIAELAGYTITNRIELKNRKTGKTYK